MFPELHYTNEEINHKRENIVNTLENLTDSFQNGEILTFCDHDLILLFQLYDRIFWNDWFAAHGPEDLQFCYSGRLTSSAGLTKVQHLACSKHPNSWHYKLEISRPLLKCFSAERHAQVNGLVPASQLETLLLIFEHELCHIAEFLCLGNSNCRGEAFRDLALRLFGHSNIVHNLRAASVPSSLDFTPGETVCFHWKNKLIQGMIVNITKRATIMVPNRRGEYADKTGTRYQKFYVPLARLQKCEEHSL